MPRSLSTNYAPANDLSIVAPIDKGGTSVTTEEEAITILGAVKESDLNKKSLPVKLNASGKVPDNYYPSSVVNYPTLEGNRCVQVGSTSVYIISNFDFKLTYDVSVDNGFVGVSAGNVYFTAPSVECSVKLTINGRVVTINVVEQRIRRPICTAYDLGDANIVTILMDVDATVFVAGSGTHISTDWQIATDRDFVNLVYNNDTDTVNKNSITVTNLAYSTTYYCRVRKRDNRGNNSEWSFPVFLTTNTLYKYSKEQAKLIASDGASFDQFGVAVAMSDNGTIVVAGAINKTGTYANQGRAYVYKRINSTWTQNAAFTLTDPVAANEFFGQAVAISGDGTILAVAAPGKATNTGAVYIYTANANGIAWDFSQKITASDPTTNSYFGLSIAFDTTGTRLVCGSYNKNTTLAGQGAVYIFLRTGSVWAQEAKLLSNDPTASAQFGFSVSMNGTGDRIVVGANNKTVGITNDGAVYVFSRSGVTWTQEQRLAISDSASYDYFGQSVKISRDGTRLVASTKKAVSSFASAGIIYVFSRSGTVWTQEAKISNPAPTAANELFGFNVDMHATGNYLMTGAYGDASVSGIVYYYIRNGVNWSLDSTCTSSDLATGNYFGYAVSMAADGLYSAIGAYSNSAKGAVYVFTK
jgi:hypothetical protein